MSLDFAGVPTGKATNFGADYRCRFWGIATRSILAYSVR